MAVPGPPEAATWSACWSAVHRCSTAAPGSSTPPLTNRSPAHARQATSSWKAPWRQRAHRWRSSGTRQKTFLRWTDGITGLLYRWNAIKGFSGRCAPASLWRGPSGERQAAGATVHRTPKFIFQGGSVLKALQDPAQCCMVLAQAWQYVVQVVLWRYNRSSLTQSKRIVADHWHRATRGGSKLQRKHLMWS